MLLGTNAIESGTTDIWPWPLLSETCEYRNVCSGDYCHMCDSYRQAHLCPECGAMMERSLLQVPNLFGNIYECPNCGAGLAEGGSNG